MFRFMFKLIYFPLWWLKCRIFKKEIPLQSVVFITNKCNLKCKHCFIFATNNVYTKSYEQVVTELKKCYKTGSRIVDIEGGEPTLWKDGDKNINDLIKAAKKIGFFSVTVTTNAQQPIDCISDLVWVSVDGTREIHDEIRGSGTYEKLVENIENSTHPCININMTVNNLNYAVVEDVAEFAAKNPKIKSVSYNFYTPHILNNLSAKLALPEDIKHQVIDKIIQMKKNKIPVMNSFSALKLMKEADFERRCWITNFVMPDGTFEKDCAGEENANCEVCGYCMKAEMACVYNLAPDTILSGLKVRR